MTNLILNSLEINEFRAFERLLIESFGRVNLIVGKNNVGKSTLLESVWLYTQKAMPSVLLELLRSRDEYSSRSSRVSTENLDNSRQTMWDIKHLFFGRVDLIDNPKSITIGPINTPDDTLSLSIKWYISETDEEGSIQRRPTEDFGDLPDAEPYIVTQIGTKPTRLQSLDRLMQGRGLGLPPSSEVQTIPSHFLKANGLSAEAVAQLWDNVALTDWEQAIVDALHIIAPEVTRISFVGSRESRADRIPVVRIQGLSDPIPLRSMGEGMNRLLGIILALVNARNGILLVDEIESGLHYTVQADIWRMIFRISRRLSVQVFATTHSWDCIEAFQKAAAEDIGDEGTLIRLENKGLGINATLFNERKLSIATREQIEVR